MHQLRWGSVSITGNFRENNEDRCLTDPQGRYFLVCDGMGGQAAGERASELAVELFSKTVEQSIDFQHDDATKVNDVVSQAVVKANMEIMALGEVDPDFHNMGTTIVFLIAVGDHVYVGGIGDSRAYRFHDDALVQLTTDHSLTQALIDAGTITAEEAINHRYRNVLYRYLGTKEGGTGIEITDCQRTAGDRYVLCSDGVTDGLEEGVLAEIVKTHDDPQEAAAAIVQAAQDGGSRDNITCLVVCVV